MITLEWHCKEILSNDNDRNAMFKKETLRLKNKLKTFRCHKHKRQPSVKVVNIRGNNLIVNLNTCCDDFSKRIERRLWLGGSE